MDLYLVDASIYIFRAWFSLPHQLVDNENRPINAAYGFTKFLTELIEQTKLEKIVIAFDESLTHSFRNEIYPPYKMNRELPPQELKSQFKLCKEIVAALGISLVSHNEYEADDLIGTLAKAGQSRGERVCIVSADKDLAQLLSSNDCLWDFARRRRFDLLGIEDKFGIRAEQMTDYLGLCGDSVDNIPGVPSVGPKKAQILLNHFESIEMLYERIDDVAKMDIRGAKGLVEKLRLYKEQALLSKLLATIVTDAPINTDESFTRVNAVDSASINLIVDSLGGRGEGLFQRMIRGLGNFS